MLGLLFLLIVLKRDLAQNRALERHDVNALVRHTHTDKRVVICYEDVFLKI